MAYWGDNAHSDINASRAVGVATSGPKSKVSEVEKPENTTGSETYKHFIRRFGCDRVNL